VVRIRGTRRRAEGGFARREVRRVKTGGVILIGHSFRAARTGETTAASFGDLVKRQDEVWGGTEEPREKTELLIVRVKPLIAFGTGGKCWEGDAGPVARRNGGEDERGV